MTSLSKRKKADMQFSTAVVLYSPPPVPESPVSPFSPQKQRVNRNSITSLNPLDDLHQRLSVWDPNLPDFSSIFGRYNNPNKPKVIEEKGEGEDGEENSPYAEVRAVVRNYDEVMPVNTVRAWVIGLTLTILGSGVNTLFSLRNPSIGIGGLIAQLISYAGGNLWAKTMPTREWKTFGVIWTLNPGPFNLKEHTLIVVMAAVSFGVAYATDIILAQVAFYEQNFGMAFQFLLLLSTQMVGYGLAGVMRRFLVWPASMIWPTNLASVALMYSLHEKPLPQDPTIIGGMMSRYRWFFYVSCAAFTYYWIPGFLMQFLSIFAFITWIKPNNVIINQLFGGTSGISILPLTLDWTQITGFVGSPLIPPFHAIANIMIGVILFFVFGSVALHYSNSFYGTFLPMSDSSIYDHFGQCYNISRIVTPELTLDLANYEAYSPLFISTTFALSYGLSFAAISSLLVYTYLYHGSEIWARFRKIGQEEQPDIHMKLMSEYREVPEWWYLSFFGAMCIISLVIITVYPTELAWWAFILAIFLSSIFAIPIGMIQAITNVQIGLNVLTEFLFGYIQPGRPLAIMLFKTYGYITMSQGLGFVGDLKFGHYMKIPPRSMFAAQVIATIVGTVVQVIVLNISLDSIPEVCTKHQPQKFSCPGASVFFSASVIWGLIGPQRIFSPGQTYSALFIFFPIGAALPALFYFSARRFPKSPLKYLNAPLILGGAGAIPPATPLNYLTWGVIGYIFQYQIRRRNFAWWSRLNYLTSSGLDLGLAVSTLIIFLAFTMNGISAPQWWGNTVVTSTLDAQDLAVQVVLGPGETFGPRKW